jgi:hypothetical protein
MMARVIGATMALLLGVPAAGQQHEIVRTHRADGHTVQVRIDIGPFDLQEHTVRKVQPAGHSGSPCLEIDGRSQQLGTDCEVPTTEIKSLSVIFDGVKLTIPRDLYRDCFNPRPGNSLAVQLTDDRKGAFVFFSGSDAAGSYQVVWVFSTDGRHSRLSCPPSVCSDMGFLNFDSSFLSSDDE